MVRRAGHDYVNVVPVHELSEVVGLGGRLVPFGKLTRRGFCVVRIHVTHGEDVAETARIGRITTSLPAAADQGDSRALVLRQRLRGCRRGAQLPLNKPGGQTHLCGHQGATLQK